MAAQYLIKKNAAAGAIFWVGLTPRASDGTYKSSPTLAAGDVKLSGDGGSFNNLGTLPTVTPAAGKAVKVTLSQAETNYDNIVIVFSDAAGAEWTDLLLSFETVDAQLADIYSRIGAPVGASISADIAGVQADTDNIQTRIPAALVGGRMDSSVGAMAANVLTAAATAADFGTEIAAAVWDYLTSAATTVGSLGKLLVDNVNATISSRLATSSYTAPDNASITAIKSKTDNLPSDPADASDIAASFSSLVNITLAQIASYIDTEVQSIKDKTDNLPASPASVSDVPTVSDIVTGIFGHTIETGMTFLGSIRGMASALFGKVSGAGTVTEVFRSAKADDADRLTVTVDADGNRTDVASAL